MMIEDYKYKVHCPVCGRLLFKTEATATEIECGRCKSDLLIWVADGSAVVAEKEKADRTAECLISIVKRLESMAG